MGIDKEEDDGLTEEERAALADGEEEGAEAESDDGEGEKKEEKDAVGDAPGRDDGQAPEPEGDEDAGQESEPEKPGEAPAAQVAPLLVAQPIEDADGRLRAIDELKSDIRKKYDDGDITFEEYEAKKDELIKQEREIERAVDKAQIAADLQNQQLMNKWRETCEDFLANNPVIASNQRRYHLFNEEVKAVGTAPENAELSMKQVLEKAKANLIEDGLLASDKPTQKAAASPRADLPPNLAKLPAAENEDTNGGRFASLERLLEKDPIAYEEALAKMSDAERNAYLAT